MSCFLFRYLNHFGYIFIYGVWAGIHFIFTCPCPAFPEPLAEETVFSLLCILACLLCCRLVHHGYVGLFEGSLIFPYWSICLFLCQQFAVWINVVLQYCLKSGNVALCRLAIFPKNCFDNSVSLVFPNINILRHLFQFCEKNIMGNVCVCVCVCVCVWCVCNQSFLTL